MTTWLLLRTAGILALGLLTVAVALGVAGPAIRRPAARLVSVTLHRTAAVTGTLLVLAHAAAAILDPWVEVSLPAAFLPGFSAWEPLWIGLGALALDALLLLAITSALRHRNARLWWNVHVVSYVAYAVAWAHAAGAGSDAGDPIMLGLAAGSAGVLLVATVLRLRAPAAPAGVGLPAAPREKVHR